jgi:hypothetical protein
VGGKLLRRLSNHQKTVTSVLVSPMTGANGGAPRLLSGSLDGHVKVCALQSIQPSDSGIFRIYFRTLS